MLTSIRAAAAAAIVLPGAAAQAEGPVLTIVNASSHELRQLYLSAFSSQRWSPDMLEERILAPDQLLEIPLDTFADECRFNVRAIDDTGRSLELWDYDICTRGPAIAIEDRPLSDTLPDFFDLPSG